MTVSILGYVLVAAEKYTRLKKSASAAGDLCLIRSLPSSLRSACIDLLEQSQSQLRQDVFALAMNGFKRNGFFVEFGATNGKSLSNTYLMEKNFGWKGILAEPAIDWHESLKANRSCAIDTRCVWSASGETVLFTQAPRRANSSVSAYVPIRRRLRGNTYEIGTVSLNDLLDHHGAPSQIDFLSVDTEGSEFEILNAVNWSKWSFGVITVEHMFTEKRQLIFDLLTGHGYHRVYEDASNYDDWYVSSAIHMNLQNLAT